MEIDEVVKVYLRPPDGESYVSRVRESVATKAGLERLHRRTVRTGLAREGSV